MIVIPFLSSHHAPLIRSALAGIGLDCLVVDDSGGQVIARGMESVNNDACYASILSVGQLLSVADGLRDGERAGCGANTQCGGGAMAADAVSSDRIDVIVSQLCPHCRAGDLSEQIKRAFESASPVLGRVRSIAEAASMLPAGSLRRLSEALVLGDALLQAELAVRPHLPDGKRAAFERLIARWRDTMRFWLAQGSSTPFSSLLEAFDRAVHPFFSCERFGRPLIGVIGAPGAVFNVGINNDLVRCLEREGCEAAVPYLAPIAARALVLQKGGERFAEHVEACCETAAKTMTCVRFPCPSVSELRRRGTEVVSEWVDCGMGWALAGQALLFAEGGVDGIAYARTFGCLSGHVCGQGIMKRLREIGNGRGSPVAYATIEYDPGTSALNQANRIKLLAAIARGGS